MTDSTASYPAIVEERLPLGVCWVQPTLCGWTHMKASDGDKPDRRKTAT